MLLAWLRSLLVIETLPPAPPRGEEPAARRSWLRLLLAPEELARDPERAPTPRRSWLRLLLAPEELPHDPPAAPPRPRARWLAWLFAPEKLDR